MSESGDVDEQRIHRNDSSTYATDDEPITPMASHSEDGGGDRELFNGLMELFLGDLRLQNLADKVQQGVDRLRQPREGGTRDRITQSLDEARKKLKDRVKQQRARVSKLLIRSKQRIMEKVRGELVVNFIL